MTRVTVATSTTTTLGTMHPLATEELAHACGVGIDWVAQLVEIGIVEVSSPTPAQWRFESADLQRALAARRLERDFGIGLDAAALILDLQREVRRLKATLRAQGLED
ncbi:chaperone modulator CbpM [Variovorax guangxiensis]|uniref:MerR family transcriptional regulator n=1 Tax=Variovorax guangxiensis TaxID=1775474 RepID=A0A502DXX0_9BURK|nr:chaperone modulator CbpM [Variovorax guangxiensis]TPG26683.1 MerR family transcriptional regulator [Variovorax ginsengisoli]TPG30408.1 MerR family transcriptional regulator [Variovorax guangxiensis]